MKYKVTENTRMSVNQAWSRAHSLTSVISDFQLCFWHLEWDGIKLYCLSLCIPVGDAPQNICWMLQLIWCIPQELSEHKYTFIYVDMNKHKPNYKLVGSVLSYLYLNRIYIQDHSENVQVVLYPTLPLIRLGGWHNGELGSS